MDLGCFTKRMLGGEGAGRLPDADQARLVRALRAAAPLAGMSAAGCFNPAAARGIALEGAGAEPVTIMKSPFTFVF